MVLMLKRVLVEVMFVVPSEMSMIKMNDQMMRMGRKKPKAAR